jgi:hypothetical protein
MHRRYFFRDVQTPLQCAACFRNRKSRVCVCVCGVCKVGDDNRRGFSEGAFCGCRGGRSALIRQVTRGPPSNWGSAPGIQLHFNNRMWICQVAVWQCPAGCEYELRTYILKSSRFGLSCVERVPVYGESIRKAHSKRSLTIYYTFVG